VWDYDYEHNAKFLGSRNKAIVLVLLDTGARLSELIGVTLEDINTSTGNIRIMGKGNKAADFVRIASYMLQISH
jgi:integrase/recombinase XerD